MYARLTSFQMCTINDSLGKIMRIRLFEMSFMMNSGTNNL